jgi:hypothetical protein
VFVPFHYGSWGEDRSDDDHERAANELTIVAWDPVSKQPIVKSAAVRVEKVAPSDGTPSPAPTTTASQPAAPRVEVP